jgi:hypothetical protein
VRGRRTTTVVSVIAALAVGHGITSRLDVSETEDEPFLEAAQVGEVARVPYGDVEVTDVRPARYVVPRVSTELARIAAGVFVLVSVRVTASREPISFQAAYLVDDRGREYRSSAKADCGLSVESSTGIPAYVLFCFDVPPEALSGLRLRLARGNLIYSTLQGDAVADVDLGISAADEKSWPDTQDAFLAETTTREPFELTSITVEVAP